MVDTHIRKAGTSMKPHHTHLNVNQKTGSLRPWYRYQPPNHDAGSYVFDGSINIQTTVDAIYI